MFDFSLATLWWVVALLLVAVELTTGSFYLLMLALGAAAAAVAAHLGLSGALQCLVAAAVGGSAVLWWRGKQAKVQPSPDESNRDLILDIGERVLVERWADDASGEVRYRGAVWQASYCGSGQPCPGWHLIQAIKGSTLQLIPEETP